MLPLRSLLTALALLTCLSCFSQTNWSQANYPAGTLGSELQPYFYVHCKTCNIFKSEKRASKLKAKGKNFIDKKIRDDWDVAGLLDREVRYSRSSLGEIFSHISDSDSIPISETINGSSAFKSYFLANSVEPGSLGSNTIWVKDCTGYLQAMSSAGIKFPQGSFSAVGDVDGLYKTQMVLKYGKFTNPLYSLIENNDVGFLFNLWNYYLNSDSPETGAWYIHEFEAALVATQKEQKINKRLSTSIEGDLKFNTKLTQAQVNASSKFRQSVNSSLQSTIYGTYVMTPDNEIEKLQLPTFRDVKERIKLHVKPKIQSSSCDPLYVKGFSHKHVLKITGIPIEFEKESDWVIKPHPEDSNNRFYSDFNQVTITKVDGLENDAVYFQISGAANDSLFEIKGKSTVQLRYLLTSTSQVAGESLELEVLYESPIVLTKDQPKFIAYKNPTVKRKATFNGYDQVVATQISIDDATNIIDYKHGLRISKVTCVEDSTKIFTFDPRQQQIPSSREMTFEITTSSTTDSDDLESVSYNVNIEYAFKDRNGADKTRTAAFNCLLFEEKVAKAPEILAVRLETNIKAQKLEKEIQFDLNLDGSEVAKSSSIELANFTVTDAKSDFSYRDERRASLVYSQTKEHYYATKEELCSNCVLIERDLVLSGQLEYETTDAVIKRVEFREKAEAQLPFFLDSELELSVVEINDPSIKFLVQRDYQYDLDYQLEAKSCSVVGIEEQAKCTYGDGDELILTFPGTSDQLFADMSEIEVEVNWTFDFGKIGTHEYTTRSFVLVPKNK